MVSPVFTAAMESFGYLTSFFAPLVFARQRHGCKFPVAFGHNSTPPLGLHDHFFFEMDQRELRAEKSVSFICLSQREAGITESHPRRLRVDNVRNCASAAKVVRHC